MTNKLLFGLFFFAVLCLFFFSYTQVDLNLTLSRIPFLVNSQRTFQYIGFFQRPLSTLLFVSISILLFVLYFIFLLGVKRKHISRKEIWILIFFETAVLTFSYNAFSYDLFNYIFDAKIVTHYWQNPYLHKALDYPSDPMLLFMHWTHRVYPYGPTWLGLTIPLSVIGKNIFLLTLFLFKGMISATFLGACYFIGKILKKVSPQNEVLGLTFFSLNPLIVAESLVSSHNDIAMIFFAVSALYLLTAKKYFWAIVLLALSIGVKFATVFLLPVFIYVIFKKIDKLEKIFFYSAFLMTAALVVVSIRTTFQPWYLMYVLPFIALIPRKSLVLVPGIVLSIAGLLNYAPFLYFGNWDNPVPTILFWMFAGSLVISALILVKYKNEVI